MAQAETTTTHPLTLEQMREADQKVKERYQSTVTELPADYAEKLAKALQPAASHQGPASAADIIERFNRRNFRPSTTAAPISYETAAKVVWALLSAKCEQKNRTFEVDNNNRPIIQNLIRWFIQSDECEWELSKGIYLHGSVGTGKSLLMETMADFARAANLPTQFRIAKTTLIADTMKEEAYAAEPKSRQAAADLASLRFGAWSFDDLAEDNEPTTLSLWGNVTPVMSPLLSHRYDLFEAGLAITHATSNLKLTSPDLNETTIETRYGTRIKDRMKTMFNFVLLDGESRRK